MPATSCPAIRCPEPGEDDPPLRALIQQALHKDGSADAHDPDGGVGEQMVDVPAQALRAGQVAANAGLHVATGTACVNIVACGELETPESAYGNVLGTGDADDQLVGDGAAAHVPRLTQAATGPWEIHLGTLRSTLPHKPLGSPPG